MYYIYNLALTFNGDKQQIIILSLMIDYNLLIHFLTSMLSSKEQLQYMNILYT